LALDVSSTHSTSTAELEAQAERHFRWNAVVFVLDSLAFSIGQAFANGSTVLPAFVSQLTDSTLFIGLLSTVQSGSWLLPQVAAASLMAGKPRKRPYMLIGAVFSRPAFAFLAALLFFAGASSPSLLLAGLFASLALFNGADGLCAVAWFDIFAKAIPPHRRGRLQGLSQLITGPVSVGLGGIVGYVLASPNLPFPSNFMVLFVLAGVGYTLNLAALALYREPVGVPTGSSHAESRFLQLLLPILRHDSRFRRLVALRLAFGVGITSLPFYIVYAQQELGFSPEHIGLFLSCQLGGGTLAGLGLGQIADRFGTRAAVRLALAIGALSPGLAVLVHFGGGILGPALIPVVALIFLANGAMIASSQIGFMNYVLEIAPHDQRSTYAGLYNTINGTLLVVPILIGWLLETVSYQAVFGAIFLLLLVALAGSAMLTEPRYQRAKDRQAP